MKKRITGLILTGAAVFVLSGCDTDVVLVDPGPELVTLFLMDDLTGSGAAYVPYTCYAPDGAISAEDVTTRRGAFTFVPGERCEFDLYGFNGTVAVDEEPLYIADDLGEGKDDIPYSCNNGSEATEGTTDIFGYFEYPADAFCKFYL
ncbi:hypothetical protein YH65_09435 [Sulfurovum lithotrophicum]|uniref:Uncharacterized protein n=1 Tax=Sulfurovum lithotrophicum TaxID=206403 RepID=A0A7U4M2A5_9BACT|nr:hypothetical protein [Sulfurovum lithotrophicum]AKF25574.1 hypothetical protein YH65_09435 [Sulfurovum lithotrophicum]